MIKHTVTIHRLLQKNCLSVFELLCGVKSQMVKSENHFDI